MDRREERKLALEKSLRPQHLAFARALVEGGNLKDAYMGVYQCNDTTARSAGPRLLGSNPDIREYFTLCTGLASDAAIVRREQIIARLLEIGDNDDARAQGAAVAALKEVLAQQGSVAPTKTQVELTGKDGGPVESETKTRGLSTEAVVDLASKLFGVSPDKAAAMFKKGRTNDKDRDDSGGSTDPVEGDVR